MITIDKWKHNHPRSRSRVTIWCPDCNHQIGTANHEIGETGVVTPSIVCPHDGCTFHDHVTLANFGPPAVIHAHTKDANHLSFDCPACGEIHSFNKTWAFNDDFVKPTVTPSILVYETPAQPRCHSFITDGKIFYCTDSNHALAGQTVDLIPWTREGDY